MSVFGVFLVRIFPTFGLNTDIYSVSLGIQSECGKIRIRKTPDYRDISRNDNLQSNKNSELNFRK